MAANAHIEVLARGACVHSGRLLLCHTRGSSNTYLPGGHVEFGERTVDALKREIAEELGVDAAVGKFLGAVEHTFMQKGERHCEINLVFELTLSGMDPNHAPVSHEDYIEFLWLPVEELPESDLEPAPLRSRLIPWLDESRETDGWSSTYI